MYFLAKTLGMTRHQLLTGEARPLSAHEFTEWMAFLEVEREMAEKKD